MEKIKAGSILLTSIGLSAMPAYTFVKNICDLMPQVVSIIVTASEEKAENQYVQLAIQQFRNIGIKEINLVDLELGQTVPVNTTILYVSGGNTFKLMHFVRESGFIKVIENILDKNGVYIGVSAGAIILGSSIDSAHMGGDVDVLNLDNFNGLGFIDYEIFPHATEMTRLKVKGLEKFKNPLFIADDEVYLVEFKDQKDLNPRLL